jgi:hypothetical protein
MNDHEWDRKREFVLEEMAKAYREAARQDETARTTPQPVEDEHGYINGEGSKVKGPSWEGPKDSEWRDGEPWSWLFGGRPLTDAVE